MSENTPATIVLSCTDPSSQQQTITITSNPSYGTLGPIDQASPLSATVTYTPATDYSGPDSFTFAASGVGGSSAPATVSLTVGWVDTYYGIGRPPGWVGAPPSTLSPGPPASGASPSAVVPPVLSALLVSSDAFSVNSRPTTVAVRLLVSFRLSQAAGVTFRLERVIAGRREGGRCLAASPANLTGPACVRRVHAPRKTTRDEAAGPDAFTVTDGLDGMALTPGSYELVATPVSSGSSGTAPGAALTVRFSIPR
jgi:Bacterial Ig domain